MHSEKERIPWSEGNERRRVAVQTSRERDLLGQGDMKKNNNGKADSKKGGDQLFIVAVRKKIRVRKSTQNWHFQLREKSERSNKKGSAPLRDLGYNR